MNTEIEQRLRESASAWAMDRPVDDILARGDRLRRRRSRGVMVGAGVAATVTAFAASLALPPGSTPGISPAVAAWSGGQTNLSPDELRAISDACLLPEHESPVDDAFSPAASIPVGTLPLVAESRDGRALAYFRSGDVEAGCVTDLAADGSVGAARLAGARVNAEPLPPGTDLDRGIGFAHADPGVIGGPVNDLWAVGQISPRVDRVTASVNGESFEGAIVDGFALFWLPQSFDPSHADGAVFTAYDAEGRVLARVDELTGVDDPQGPNDDAQL